MGDDTYAQRPFARASAALAAVDRPLERLAVEDRELHPRTYLISARPLGVVELHIGPLDQMLPRFAGRRHGGRDPDANGNHWGTCRRERSGEGGDSGAKAFGDSD